MTALPDDPPPARPPDRGLIGRAGALIELLEAVEQAPLVTLLGPGGVGKTRLARHFSETSTVDRPGGIWFVDLSDVSQADQMVSELARVLGLDTKGARSDSEIVARVAASLEARGRCLLVLDNLEQLVEAAASVVGPLLENGPGTRVLVTSRRPLGLPGERVLPLAPLSASDAIALFVQCTRRQRPTFVLDDAARPVLAELARRLDGLPLAIELAASRSAVVSPADLLRHLDRPDLLREPGRAPERHASLTRAIAWSWMLLDATAQRVLACASVFRGGFDITAAEAVIDGDPLALWDALRVLQDASLLQSVPAADGTARVGLLHTVRTFAHDRLVAPEAVRARHAAWAANLATRLTGGLDGPDERAALATLATEQLNLRAAFAWSCTGAPVDALRIAAALAALHWRQGVISNAVPLLAEAPVDEVEAQHPLLCAQVLRHRAEFDQQLGRGDRALAQLARAVGLAGDDLRLGGELRCRQGVMLRRLSRLDEADEALSSAIERLASADAPTAEGIALGELGVLRRHRNDLEGSRTHLERAVALLGTTGALRQQAIVEGQLAITLRRAGHNAEAEAITRSALVHMRAVNDENNEMILMGNLANLVMERGAVAESRALLEETLSRGRIRGHRRSVAHTLLTVAAVHIHAHAWREAETTLLEAREIMRQVSYMRGEVYATTHLGRAQHCQGAIQAAIQYYEDAVRRCASAGLSAPPGLTVLHAAACAEAGDPAGATARLDATLAGVEPEVRARLKRAEALCRAFIARGAHPELRRRLSEHWAGGLAI